MSAVEIDTKSTAKEKHHSFCTNTYTGRSQLGRERENHRTECVRPQSNNRLRRASHGVRGVPAPHCRCDGPWRAGMALSDGVCVRESHTVFSLAITRVLNTARWLWRMERRCRGRRGYARGFVGGVPL